MINATPYHPPALRDLRAYNVNRGMGACCPGLGNGEFLEREAEYIRRARERTLALRQMTPEQIAQKAELDKAIAESAAWRAEWARGVEPGRNLGNMYLSTRGKQLRNIILARDWPALFKLLPLHFAPGETNASGPGVWRPEWAISKYSFRGDGPNKTYIPWTKADIRSFVFSPYYTIQPGHTCSDDQREQGVAALWKAQARHKQKFGPSSYAIVWPIYPGSGYGWQTFGCMPDKQSWWVKNRGKVAAVVGAVAAVTLGPAVISSISGGGATATGAATATAGGVAEAGVAATGIVGAGAKAGALATTVTVKAGAGAAITAKGIAAAGAVAGAAEAGTLLARTKALVDTVNKGRTVAALIDGELPPPPINLTGDSFTEWALNIAKDEAKDELSDLAGEYMTERLREQALQENEARLRAEIEEMQRELASLLPPGTPIEPSPELDEEVRRRIAAMQDIERQREQQTTVALLAVGAGAVFMMS